MTDYPTLDTKLSKRTAYGSELFSYIQCTSGTITDDS